MTFTASLLFNCQVFVDVDNKNEWRDCFDVSGVKLPTGLYFGASAATGQLAGIYKELTICPVFTLWLHAWDTQHKYCALFMQTITTSYPWNSMKLKFLSQQLMVKTTLIAPELCRSRQELNLTEVWKFLMQWIPIFVCAAHEQNDVHLKGNFKMLKIIAF